MVFDDLEFGEMDPNLMMFHETRTFFLSIVSF